MWGSRFSQSWDKILVLVPSESQELVPLHLLFITHRPECVHIAGQKSKIRCARREPLLFIVKRLREGRGRFALGISLFKCCVSLAFLIHEGENQVCCLRSEWNHEILDSSCHFR